jgi:hypothetical protein
MAKARCRGVDDFVNDLAAKLAIVIAEAQRSGLPPSRRTATVQAARILRAHQ